MRPEEIEQASMRTIAAEMEPWQGPEENLPVVMRVIHTTADFEFQKNLRFTPDVVGRAREALRTGTTIVTDTMMAAAGVNKKACQTLGVQVVCRMSDAAVREEAASRGVTRAVVSMEAAVRETPQAIFAIGNAPTALVSLDALMAAELLRPALLIGVPVGFVNVVESKELIIEGGRAPYIVARGRKGGSNVAAAICNALLYQIRR